MEIQRMAVNKYIQIIQIVWLSRFISYIQHFSRFFDFLSVVYSHEHVGYTWYTVKINMEPATGFGVVKTPETLNICEEPLLVQ